MFKIFSIFDSEANAFLLPFYTVNVAVAKRNVSRACSDEATDFHFRPASYSLFEVGTWDPNTGKLEVPAAPVPHGLLTSFVNVDGVK